MIFEFYWIIECQSMLSFWLPSLAWMNLCVQRFPAGLKPSNKSWMFSHNSSISLSDSCLLLLPHSLKRGDSQEKEWMKCPHIVPPHYCVFWISITEVPLDFSSNQCDGGPISFSAEKQHGCHQWFQDLLSQVQEGTLVFSECTELTNSQHHM